MNKIIPIFVLGTQRSGTTWLANILCNHSEIAGVQHSTVNGIMESCYYSHIYSRFGELNHISNQVEFSEILDKSDYFRLAGADKVFLYSLLPDSYHSVFKSVMDNFANNNNATFWLEKTPFHTLYINQISNDYPDGKFIGIKRQINDVVRSALGMKKNELNRNLHHFEKLKVLKNTIKNYILYNKKLDSYYKRNNNLYLTTYEQLSENKEKTLIDICSFLGISFQYNMLNDLYKPNTSFKIKSSRKHIINNFDLIRIKGYYFLYFLFSYFLSYKWIVKEKVLKKRRGIRLINKLPDKYFRLYLKEINLSKKK